MATQRLYDQYGNVITNLTQWDSNVILQLRNFKYDTAPIVHFAKADSQASITVFAALANNVASVVVPNVLLTTAGDNIDVFFFQYDNVTDEGRALYHFAIPVTPKPRPNDYEYVDNTDIIELSSLSIRLEALVAEAAALVDVKIGELNGAYDASLKGLSDAIAADRAALEADVTDALSTMVESVADGSPRDIFTNVSELSNKPAGVYLYVNAESEDNGYIYYWDGTTLSNKLLYYAGVVINNGSITYEKLSNALKKQAISHVIPYVLEANEWQDGVQTVDISDTYTVTAHTKADIDPDAALINQLTLDGCGGIYIVTNENNDNSLVAHAINNVPTVDITIQLSVKETI